MEGTEILPKIKAWCVPPFQVDEVKPVRLKRGEPQLTMTSIYALEDLAPFFKAICNGVTCQQTKGGGPRRNMAPPQQSVLLNGGLTGKPKDVLSSEHIIDAIFERDFLEPIPKS